MVGVSKLVRIGAAIAVILGFVVATAVVTTVNVARADAAPTIQPKQVDCAIGWTTHRFGADWAYGTCYVPGGQEARLRADCPLFPDRYSDWKAGRGNRSFETRRCPSVRRGIAEFRST